MVPAPVPIYSRITSDGIELQLEKVWQIIQNPPCNSRWKANKEKASKLKPPTKCFHTRN